MLDSFTRLRFLPEHKLVTWYPEGILNWELATKIVEFLTFQEKILDEPFNRFASWEGISEVRFKLTELNDLADRRRSTYGTGPRVKSAFHATRRATFGLARLFSILMEHSPIEVRVFREIEAAAQWLEVTADSLRLE